MKSKILVLILSFLAGFSIFATQSYAVSTEDKAQSKADGEIIATLMAVNRNEIADAKEALAKKPSKSVKHYARMLKAQHSENLKKVLKLSKKTGISPIETPTVASLQKNGADELKQLSELKGKDFEKAYVDAMVKGHTDVLKMLDDNLLKNVTNPSLKKLLLATRPHIEAHLKQGEALQKELK